ncbi:MAG: type I methionyl aminopeptidase [Actinomycetaceae bacterium]|nr:type I methionyl aminopeptidase [Arcanobacterium sp.]MDD7686670.1 type I methionyl aminopeptidase [Actinomycetaceae bacterium]MDY5273823.1 type I methionyl aminopeptidase [Arcanobacterium sp.]
MRIRKHIELKSDQQIIEMRRAALVVADIHEALLAAAAPGISTKELDDVALGVLKAHGAVSNFYGYEGYPAQTCISVNSTVVHGIPGGEVLRAGDIVSFDCGALLGGWHADACVSTVVAGGDPRVTARRQRLSEITREAMWAGIAAMACGEYVEDIGAAVQDYVDSVPRNERPSIVREFIGHGLGTKMHMEPEVYNFRVRRKVKLRPGMVLCIEPILAAGSPANTTLEDDWTVKTLDGSDGCHWEHEIALHSRGIWVLSARDGGASELARFGVTPVPLGE